MECKKRQNFFDSRFREFFVAIRRTIILVVTAALSGFLVVGCNKCVETADECVACDIEVVKSELYSLNSDLDILDAMRRLELQDPELEHLTMKAVLRHIMIIRAADFDVAKLPGLPLEALCRLSSNDVTSLIDDFPDERMGDIAQDFIEEVSPAVAAHVREVQKSMLGTDCNLSTR